jgi:hypothetical protein
MLGTAIIWKLTVFQKIVRENWLLIRFLVVTLFPFTTGDDS